MSSFGGFLSSCSLNLLLLSQVFSALVAATVDIPTIVDPIVPDTALIVNDTTATTIRNNIKNPTTPPPSSSSLSNSISSSASQIDPNINPNVARTATIKYNEYVTDMGQNISIPCTTADNPASTIWLKEGHNQTRQFHAGGVLRLYRLRREDAAIYVCLVATNSTIGQEILMQTQQSAISTTTASASSASSDTDSNSNSSINATVQQPPPPQPLPALPAIYENVDGAFVEALRVRVIVRSVPCAVTRLSMRISTILGVLIWEYNRTTAYSHPLKSFTAEYRLHNATQPQPWERLDPKNISPNIRYMEIYHLLPNTTYEFRIWGNNYIGPGEIASTIVTTLPEIGDDVELLRILMRDAKDFDTHVWFYAVGVVMGALVLLGLTVCLLLVRDWYEDDGLADADEWTTLDLIPNIILNPGFFEPDDPDNPSPPYTRTIIFGEDELSSSDDESEEISIPFKRKLSLFFTGDTIKRQL